VINIGRDIRICTEIKLESGNWVSADDFIMNPQYPHPLDGYEGAYIIKPIYDTHDHTVFSILCEGAGRHNLNPSISPARGMPSNCCKRVKQECRSFGKYAKLHSYLTLKEIEEHAEKLGRIRHCGYVRNEDVNKALQGLPVSSSNQVGNNDSYTWLEWDRDEKPLQQIIEALRRIRVEKNRIFLQRKEISTEDIRIIFWFFD